jgi:non-ribosomal peptide synthetase component F
MSSWKTHARWAAIAWGAVTVLQAGVAYLSVAFPPERLSFVFTVSALVSLLATGLLASGPSARVLLGVTVWAGVNLVLGLWALPPGAGLEVAVPFGLLLAVAGLESYRAWRGRRQA